MKKKPQAGLTQELMQKLSQDAYCFNLDHENEIERLKAEIGRLTKDKEELKLQIEGQETKLKQEYLAIIEGKKGELEDLRDEIAKLVDENKTSADIARDLENKLVTSKDEVKKEFRKEGKCFDFMHKAIEGRRGHTLSIPEIFALSVSLLYRGPTDNFGGDSIQIYVPLKMAPLVEGAKKAIDVKRARDLGEELKKGDLSKYLKGGLQ
jgi:hypothetical protein